MMKNIKKQPKFRSIQRAYDYAYKNNYKLNLNNEKLIAIDCRYSYLYAKYVLKGRFELGEAVIATNADYSYLYARDVLKGRFELGEEAIATNASCSLDYAEEILKGRFKIYEKEMVKNVFSIFSYNYLTSIFKGVIPLDFLELSPIRHLESIIFHKEDVKNIDDVIKALFKKKLLE